VRIVEIVQEINSRSRGGLFLIGVDGIGGSGKSTFVDRLAVQLTACKVIELDDFYSPQLRRQDWNQVAGVLRRLRAGKTVTVKNKQLAPEGYIIVEGVYALNKELREFYDFKIWVECEPAIALQRGLARSAARGLDETDIWTNEWLPNELRYKETQQPQAIADAILDRIEGEPQ
jgi:uridine kinase